MISIFIFLVELFTIITGMLIPSFQKMGTVKITYSSFKVQLYFPIQGLAVIVKKKFSIRRFAAHVEIFFYYRISLNNKRAYYYFYKFLDAQTIQGRALIKGANYFLPGP